MPIDYQPPPFSIVTPYYTPRFEAVCAQALASGVTKVNFRVKDFETGELTVDYSAVEVSIAIAKLRKNNLYVDYGTDMDSKECRDYIIIKVPEVELKAEAKKL